MTIKTNNVDTSFVVRSFVKKNASLLDSLTEDMLALWSEQEKSGVTGITTASIITDILSSFNKNSNDLWKSSLSPEAVQLENGYEFQFRSIVRGNINNDPSDVGQLFLSVKVIQSDEKVTPVLNLSGNHPGYVELIPKILNKYVSLQCPFAYMFTPILAAFKNRHDTIADVWLDKEETKLFIRHKATDGMHEIMMDFEAVREVDLDIEKLYNDLNTKTS